MNPPNARTNFIPLYSLHKLYKLQQLPMTLLMGMQLQKLAQVMKAVGMQQVKARSY